MNRIAYIFPGQGSQAVGMGKDLFDNFEPAREVFQIADESLGFKISEMCFEGDESALQLTANTQPAILTVSIAAYRTMLSEGFPKPAMAAGHSLGEYSALVAAGVLDFSEAVRIVHKRGTYMQEAVPIGKGAMAAILGSDLETVTDACAEAAGDGVCSPANINSPSQIVIAGDSDAIERACGILKERGAKRTIRLNVSAPFHCALMQPAELRLEADLLAASYGNYQFPVVHNYTAEPGNDPSAVCNLLTKQVTSPVRWVETIERMRREGISKFVEVGPGKVLSGLVRQIDKDAVVFNVEDSATIRKSLETI